MKKLLAEAFLMGLASTAGMYAFLYLSQPRNQERIREAARAAVKEMRHSIDVALNPEGQN